MKLSSDELAIMKQVKELIEKEYQYDLPIYQLAHRFGIDENRLRKGFPMAYQIPIHEYLTKVRIERAKERLSDTDEPIKTIAFNVGYDSKSLYKQFKKQTGMAPLVWRKIHAAVQTG